MYYINNNNTTQLDKINLTKPKEYTIHFFYKLPVYK